MAGRQGIRSLAAAVGFLVAVLALPGTLSAYCSQTITDGTTTSGGDFNFTLYFSGGGSAFGVLAVTVTSDTYWHCMDCTNKGDDINRTYDNFSSGCVAAGTYSHYYGTWDIHIPSQSLSTCGDNFPCVCSGHSAYLADYSFVIPEFTYQLDSYSLT